MPLALHVIMLLGPRRSYSLRRTSLLLEIILLSPITNSQHLLSVALSPPACPPYSFLEGLSLFLTP